jgi:hypothetical protein
VEKVRTIFINNKNAEFIAKVKEVFAPSSIRLGEQNFILKIMAVLLKTVA